VLSEACDDLAPVVAVDTMRRGIGSDNFWSDSFLIYVYMFSIISELKKEFPAI